MALITGFTTISPNALAKPHLYELVEEVLHAEKDYANAYMGVDLRMDLKELGAAYKVPTLWDDGKTFRLRIVATARGEWRYSTSNQASDSGFGGNIETFSAAAWTKPEMQANPNRHRSLFRS